MLGIPPGRFWRSLKGQALLVTLAVMVPTVVVGAVGVAAVQSGFRESVHEVQFNRALLRADHVDSHLNTSLVNLQSTAENDAFAAAVTRGDAVDTKLRPLTEKEGLEVVWFQRTNGSVEAAYPYSILLLKRNHSDATTVAADLVRKNISMSGVLQGEQDFPSSYAVMAAPVHHQGRLVGVLAGIMDIESLGQAVDFAENSPNRVTIVDADGIVVYDRDADRLMMQAESEETSPRDDSAYKSGVSETNGRLPGSGTVVARAQSTTAGWDVVVATPAAVAYAPLLRLGPALAGLYVLAVAGTGAVTFTLARRVARPLSRLEGAADAIAGGDLSTRVPPVGVDELDRLARAFNGMAAEVQAQRRQLRSANARLEAEVARRTAELAERNRELEAFNHTVAHDLKEPLRGIQAYSTFLAEDHSHGLDDEARDYLHRIGHGVKRMGAILDALLRHATLGQEREGERVDMDAVVDDALLLSGARVAERRAVVRRDGPLPWCWGDRVRLTEVVANLVDNALKYNTSSAPVVAIRGREDGGAAVYEVEDNGIGVPPDRRDEAFRLFRRLHPRGAYGGGTGAGLAIVRRVLEGHGGSVELDGGPDGGTVVRFRVPRQRPDGPAPSGDGGQSAPTAKDI